MVIACDNQRIEDSYLLATKDSTFLRKADKIKKCLNISFQQDLSCCLMHCIRNEAISFIIAYQQRMQVQKIGHSLKSCLVPHFKNKCLFIQEYQIPIFV